MKKAFGFAYRSRLIRAVIVTVLVIACGAFLVPPEKNPEKIENYFTSSLKKLQNEVKALDDLALRKAPISDMKRQIINTRLVYKELAVLTDYFNPFEASYLNGPPINRVEDENPTVIISPHGFQYIQQLVFQDWSSGSYALLHKEIAFLLKFIDRMASDPTVAYKFKDALVFQALRNAVISLTILGLSGFDTPDPSPALPEAMATLRGIRNVLELYRMDIENKDPGLYKDLRALLTGMTEELSSSSGFNQFNRIRFITRLANPFFKCLTETRNRLDIKGGSGKMPVNPDALSLFSAKTFDISFFSPDARYAITPERVALGRMLFTDPILSGNKKRSCASCHRPELAFTDGLALPLSLDNKTPLKRNTPTLWNSVLQTKQFYDSRTDVLENQLNEVVHNESEMKGSLQQSVADIKNHTIYNELFRKAYPGLRDPVSTYNIANAIASYVRTLVGLNSRFDQFMNGDTTRLTIQEQRGFNLYMGKAKCGTCHFIPLFNGLVPPNFDETESEVIGVPQKGNKKRLDPDLGKYNFTKAEVDRHSFKTPTLRNIALTAPYMHNGVFKTLEEVVDFYNRGGGRRLKDSPPNQTLPFDRLHLSRQERKDLVAFMKSLTDTSYTYRY